MLAMSVLMPSIYSYRLQMENWTKERRAGAVVFYLPV